MSTAASPWRRFTPQTAALLLVAAAAWLVVVRQASTMGPMPGTMGLGLSSFVVLWALMMAAMMLPSVAPLASMYSRSVRAHRPLRLASFALGYLLVWAVTGVPAFGLAGLAGMLADGHPTAATVVGVTIFAICGLYQFTPLKYRCLQQCRSPLSLLLHYGSYRGALRDVRAGAHHGAYCVGCCWSLTVLLVALGIMNVAAMVVLAAVVLSEKLWFRGEAFPRAVGLVAFALAITVIWVPELAPGLHPDGGMGGMAG